MPQQDNILEVLSSYSDNQMRKKQALHIRLDIMGRSAKIITWVIWRYSFLECFVCGALISMHLKATESIPYTTDNRSNEMYW